MSTTDPKEEQTHPIEKDNEVGTHDGKNTENEKDVHAIKAGNVGESDAEKDMLDDPSIDRIRMDRMSKGRIMLLVMPVIAPRPCWVWVREWRYRLLKLAEGTGWFVPESYPLEKHDDRASAKGS